MALDYLSILNYQIGLDTLSNYLISLGVFFLCWIILRIFKFAGLKKLKSFAEKTRTELDDMAIKFIEQIHWPFYIFVALYIALKFVIVPATVSSVVYYIMLISITFYIVRGTQKLIRYSANRIVEKNREKGNGVDEAGAQLLSRLAGVALWILAILFILSNFKINITPLLTGVGITGIVIGFALQNILGDLFASISIFLDKPFQIGDFIIIGADMGVVKKIGIKSTRITTLQGQELVVSNKELTETRVNNYKKMQKRRIVFNFGVTYDTPVDKMKRIPEMIRDILNSIELADLDRAHFREFGASSLNFEVVYYLNSSDYNVYMDTQQAINLALKDRFEKENIEFAFPTQTIYVNQDISPVKSPTETVNLNPS